MKPKLDKESVYIRTEKGLYTRPGYTFEVEYAGYDHVFKIGVYKEKGRWVLMDCYTGMRLNSIEYASRQKAIEDYFANWGKRLLNLYLQKPIYHNHYSNLRESFSELLDNYKRMLSDNRMIVYQSRDVADPFALELEFNALGDDSIYFEAILHHVDLRTKTKTARFGGNGLDILHVVDLICRNMRTYECLDFGTSDEVQIENEVAEFLAERF